MDFERHLARQRREIDRALSRYANLARQPASLRKAIRYSLLSPGKRLRPILCLAAAEACGGDPRRVLPYACSIEFIHAYSLIHDDLPAMDDDALRRGRPTNHVVFGQALAILAGDALLTEAFHLAARSAREQRLEPRAALLVIEEIAAAAGAAGMVGGQVDDMAAENRSLRRPQVESIHRRKTGALIRAAVRVGAIASGARPAQLRRVTAYAEAVGLAFQIADDILDQEAPTAATGKTARRDRERGKATFVTAIGIDAARSRLAELLDVAMRELNAFGDAAEALRELATRIVSRGAPDRER